MECKWLPIIFQLHTSKRTTLSHIRYFIVYIFLHIFLHDFKISCYFIPEIFLHSFNRLKYHAIILHTISIFLHHIKISWYFTCNYFDLSFKFLVFIENFWNPLWLVENFSFENKVVEFENRALKGSRFHC